MPFPQYNLLLLNTPILSHSKLFPLLAIAVIRDYSCHFVAKCKVPFSSSGHASATLPARFPSFDRCRK